jgi:Skp family chaperone for outer membrane proteins
LTVVDHANQIISFDQEIQVTESLIKFGSKLRGAFSKIAETKTQGQERARIFMKVKEKLDEETSKVQSLKQQMTTNKELISRDLKQEMDDLIKQRDLEEANRKAAFEAQKIVDEQRRAKNELMDQLNRQRQVRAREVLQELLSRGIKKVGKDKI